VEHQPVLVLAAHVVHAYNGRPVDRAIAAAAAAAGRLLTLLAGRRPPAVRARQRRAVPALGHRHHGVLALGHHLLPDRVPARHVPRVHARVVGRLQRTPIAAVALVKIAAAVRAGHQLAALLGLGRRAQSHRRLSVVQELEPHTERERHRRVQPADGYAQSERHRARLAVVDGRRGAVRGPVAAPRPARVGPAEFEYLHLATNALAQVQRAQPELLEDQLKAHTKTTVNMYDNNILYSEVIPRNRL